MLIRCHRNLSHVYANWPMEKLIWLYITSLKVADPTDNSLYVFFAQRLPNWHYSSIMSLLIKYFHLFNCFTGVTRYLTVIVRQFGEGVSDITAPTLQRTSQLRRWWQISIQSLTVSHPTNHTVFHIQWLFALPFPFKTRNEPYCRSGR